MDTNVDPARKAPRQSHREVQRAPRACPGAGQLFLKDLASKYFKLVGHTISVTAAECSHCGQKLCSNKTVCTKTGAGSQS